MYMSIESKRDDKEPWLAEPALGNKEATGQGGQSQHLSISRRHGHNKWEMGGT